MRRVASRTLSSSGISVLAFPNQVIILPTASACAGFLNFFHPEPPRARKGPDRPPPGTKKAASTSLQAFFKTPCPYGQENRPVPRASFKIDHQHEEQEVGAAAGVRNWLGQPGASAAKRVSGYRESHSAVQAGFAVAAFQPGTDYAGRDREANGT